MEMVQQSILISKVLRPSSAGPSGYKSYSGWVPIPQQNTGGLCCSKRQMRRQVRKPPLLQRNIAFRSIITGSRHIRNEDIHPNQNRTANWGASFGENLVLLPASVSKCMKSLLNDSFILVLNCIGSIRH